MKKIVRLITIILLLSLTSYQGTTLASLNDGLIADYPFNGNANDESGNGNNGTVSGATLVPDRFGNTDHAYLFDGINDFIENKAPKGLPLGNSPRTISAWIKSFGETPGQKYQTIVGWGNPGTNNQVFAVERGGGGSDYPIYDDKLFVLGWNNDFAGKTTIEFNAWHHIAVTFDGSNLNVYLNGVNDGRTTKTYNTQLNSYGLRIGVTPPNDGWHMYFNGNIDDVRIYNRALSETEIQELYHLGSPPILSLTLINCCTYRVGDRFTVEAHVTNPGPINTLVEAKIGVKLPDGTQVNLGDEHLVVPIPAGLDTIFTLFDVTLPSEIPTGTWKFEGTLLGPKLGETFSREVKPFEVVP